MKALLSVAIFSCSLAAAQAPPRCDPRIEGNADKTVPARITRLVKERQFAAIEDELSDKLKRYRRGEYNDHHLSTDVYSAVAGDPALEPLLTQWAAEKPNSYWAHLLKGFHHISIGQAKRGSEFTAKTSAEQFAAMETEYQKAVAELRRAIALDPQPALAYAGLIRVARAVAGGKATPGLLAQAQVRDPLNLAARMEGIYALNPKWGGSFEELDALAAGAKAANVDSMKQRFIDYSVQIEKADFHQVATKERTKALFHYQEAARICASSSALWRASSAAYDLEDWKAVVTIVSDYLAMRPLEAKALQRRGWASEKLGRMPEAIQDYLGAADTGESWAQNKVGYLYMMGTGVPKDLQKAQQLFQRAAAKGNANAAANLEIVNKQLGLK